VLFNLETDGAGRDWLEVFETRPDAFKEIRHSMIKAAVRAFERQLIWTSIQATGHRRRRVATSFSEDNCHYRFVE